MELLLSILEPQTSSCKAVQAQHGRLKESTILSRAGNGELSWLFLPQSHARPLTILIDEDDARCLKGGADRRER